MRWWGVTGWCWLPEIREDAGRLGLGGAAGRVGISELQLIGLGSEGRSQGDPPVWVRAAVWGPGVQ